MRNPRFAMSRWTGWNESVEAASAASDSSRRFFYNGLHSLSFPWLYNHRPLWDIVVIAFMVGGTALCLTSLILAWRVLGRRLRRVAATSVVTSAQSSS